ncbi:MBL fold metallo-hydrolase [Agarivorans sp. B2Z047]|uniref:MBL fold metallo-hydrolase n=1 Tax=Agarivorans sp. B2Z047 TaxID=2652721 RepID=UPI0034CFFB27
MSIESQSGFVLIDGGTAPSFSNWESNIVGKDKIDSVIVTHIDNDHINGTIKLLQSQSCPEIDHLVESAFAKIKHYREVSTRFEKLEKKYASMASLAFMLTWLTIMHVNYRWKRLI